MRILGSDEKTGAYFSQNQSVTAYYELSEKVDLLYCPFSLFIVFLFLLGTYRWGQKCEDLSRIKYKSASLPSFYHRIMMSKVFF